jgi:hypothetical protein
MANTTQPSTRKKVPQADPHFGHVLAGPSSEELIAKHEREEAARIAKGYPKVEFGADAKDKEIDGFGDLDFDPLGTSDPLLGLKNQYGRDGFALKILSEKCCSHLGRRGYQIVKDVNGDPVRIGNMVLGEIPEKIAEQRRRAPINAAKEELGAITDQHREAVNKMKSDAKDMGLTIMERGETLKNNAGGSGSSHGQTFDMGLTVERGEAPLDQQ